MCNAEMIVMIMVMLLLLMMMMMGKTLRQVFIENVEAHSVMLLCQVQVVWSM